MAHRETQRRTRIFSRTGFPVLKTLADDDRHRAPRPCRLTWTEYVRGMSERNVRETWRGGEANNVLARAPQRIWEGGWRIAVAARDSPAGVTGYPACGLTPESLVDGARHAPGGRLKVTAAETAAIVGIQQDPAAVAFVSAAN